jgi:hypothetical protein
MMSMLTNAVTNAMQLLHWAADPNLGLLSFCLSKSGTATAVLLAHYKFQAVYYGRRGQAQPTTRANFGHTQGGNSLLVCVQVLE